MKKKILISIIVLAFIAVFIYLYIANKKTLPYKSEIASPSKLTTDTTGTSTPTGKDAFPLKNGSVGYRVEELQKWINEQAAFMAKLKIPNTPLDVDGNFGIKTETAIKAIASYSLVKYSFAAMYPVTETFYKNVVVPKELLRSIMNLEQQPMETFPVYYTL